MSMHQTQQAPVRVPLELEALLKAAKSIGLLNLSQASTMRNNVATGRLSAGVVTADLQKKLRAAKLKWEQEKTDARVWAKGRWARAIFDFQPAAESGDVRVPDLSFVKEDIIQLTLGEPMKWWRGTLASSPSREEGEFPSNYVELLEKQTATCDHHGEGELSIFAGDVIVIVRRGADSCYGFTERRAGEVKPFPSRCLQPVQQTSLATREARDAKRAARGAELGHVTVDVSDDDELVSPAESLSAPSVAAQQVAEHVDNAERNQARDNKLSQIVQDRPAVSQKRIGTGAQRFMNAGSAVIARLREEEQAILAALAALDKVAEAEAPTPPAVPVWPPSEKQRVSRKCLSWIFVVLLVLNFCAIDFSVGGLGNAHANATDLLGWPRAVQQVASNLQHVGQILDPRKPCGQDMAELMEIGGSVDDYLTGMGTVFECDGDSVEVNFGQSFGAGLVFAVFGLMCVAPDLRPRFCRCGSTGDGEAPRSSRCCVFAECLVVFLLGELLNVHHEFVAAGPTSNPSTVDLWLVTLGLFVGLTLTSLPICSCCVEYVLCSCITIRQLRRAFVSKEKQCAAHTLEIKRLRAQVAAATAQVQVTKYMHSTELDASGSLLDQREDEDKPDPLAQSDDFSDAETDPPGYHVLRGHGAHGSPEVMRIRFDSSLPIGVGVLDGGVLTRVVVGSPAADAGVTLRHSIAAINDTQISAATDKESILQLLSTRPVYVTFDAQKDTAQSEVESPPDQEPPKAKIYSEF